MIDRVFGNALWHLVKQSDAITKGVLLILLVMSIICWTIFFYKIIILRIKRRQLKDAIEQIKSIKTFEELLTVASNFTHTLPGYFLAKMLLAVKGFMQARSSIEGQMLSMHEYEFVRERMDQVVGELIAVEESYVSVLSIAASVSPLLGLFGTVWGLVQAFVSIGEMQSADIATVAPGIAEALITTLAGLMVAIPAAIMFNWIMGQLRDLERQLYTISDSVASILQHQLCTKKEGEHA